MDSSVRIIVLWWPCKVSGACKPDCARAYESHKYSTISEQCL